MPARPIYRGRPRYLGALLGVLVLLAGGAALLRAPASASAATLTPSAACYLEGQPVSIAGSGFTAGDEIALEGSQFFAAATADGGGALTATQSSGVILGTIYPAASPFAINAVDETSGATVASTTIQVANLAFRTSGGTKRPQTKRTWTFSGWFQHPGKPIYAHFTHGGRVYGNMKLGVPTGPCGMLKTNKPGIGASKVPAGEWKVQVDFDSRYSTASKPQVSGTTFVYTTFR